MPVRLGKLPVRLSRIGRSAVLALCLLVCAGASHAQPERLTVGGGRIDVEIDPALGDSWRDLRAWVLNSADTVARFYGRFPARNLHLRIRSVPGGGVRGGVTTNSAGARISVRVGVDVTREELASDWVLVHEMVHLALPEVGRRHAWLSEGLATYIEGIARAQAGRRAVPDVWAEYKHSMPVGLPKAGEGGLDQTHTWARTYWGGALFCLLADISIHQGSGNRYGLRDGLVAILQATGGYAGAAGEAGVRIEDALRIADEATRSTVLSDLYGEMKGAPVTPNLPLLWEQLGIRGEGASLEFDDRAPLAALRRALTRRAGSRPSLPR